MSTAFLKKISLNWKSGLTVALVSIPLSVSLAVASNASPVMGIVTAVWAGLIAAFFGGSDFNVVGPTGALSGILAAYASMHGQDALPMLAVISGVLILISYVFHFEKYLAFVPGSAIHGFTLGVALIIALNQLNFALGLSGLEKHERFATNVIESLSHAGSASIASVSVFVAALAALFFCKKYLPKIPGAILVAPIGIVLGYLGAVHHLPVSFQTLGDLYPKIGFAFFLPHSFAFDRSIVVPALAVALVAIIETLVSAKIADGMTDTKHDKRREMRGLAFANLASGIMGGIPATAALARTSLNVKSGAESRWSSVISGVAIAAISAFFLSSFKYIPLAVIAAILVFVAFRMVESEHFVRMFRHDRKNFAVSVAVAIVTVYEDPIIGIVIGVGMSLLLLVEKLSRGQFDLIVNDSHHHIVGHVAGDKLEKMLKDSDTVMYSIKGILCYINAEAHLIRLREKLGDAKKLVLRLRSVYYVDFDGVDAIDEIIRSATAGGKEVYLTSVDPIIAEMLENSQAYRDLRIAGRVFPKSADVLRHLGFDVG